MPDKISKIFVTGGTGFLGSYILRELLNSGFKNIHALRRKTSPKSLIKDIEDQIHWLEGDILDPSIVEEGLKDASYCIHSAAMVSFDPSERKQMYKVNIEGTANVVNIALDVGLSRLIHVSSVAAVGRFKSGVTIREDTEWEDSRFNSHYAISKRHAELEVWRGMAEGLSVNILNPSYILGAGFWEEGPSKLVRMIDNGLGWYARGTNGVVDVRDVAKMCRVLTHSKQKNERYICCAENWTYQKLFAEMASGLNKKPPRKVLTSWMAAIAWRAERLRCLITGRKPIITRETVKYSAHDFLYDSTKSIKELNFSYRPVSESVRDVCESYLISRQEKKNYGLLINS